MSFVFCFFRGVPFFCCKGRLPCNPVFKDSPMKGLELARAYYEVCAPLLQERIPDVMAQAAVGLVGEGSECFGCDDDISRDHDWGPAFCLWVPRAVGVAALPRIEEAFAALPAAFEGFPSRMDKTRRMGRVGPLSIEKFYGFFLGTENMPAAWQDWLAIPEYNLAACTNGAVFADALGEFSRRRALLLDYYPQDVHLQKLASCCMRMAQAGQYNLLAMFLPNLYTWLGESTAAEISNGSVISKRPRSSTTSLTEPLPAYTSLRISHTTARPIFRCSNSSKISNSAFGGI